MSVTHISSSVSGNVVCGRTQIRGRITQKDYDKLNNEGRLRNQVKTRVMHDCKTRPCNCTYTRTTRTNMCKDCTR